MRKLPRRLVSAATVVLALALAKGTAPARYFDDNDDAQQDLAKIAKLYADAHKRGGKVDTARVKAIALSMRKKDYDLYAVMAIYKPTRKNGIGYNPAKKGKGDGIEKRLIDLGNPTKKPMSKAQLAQEKELLLRTAYYNLAMSEIANAFPPPISTKQVNIVRLWTQYSLELKKGAQDTIKAVRANDPAALKKAFRRINDSCNNCHGIAAIDR